MTQKEIEAKILGQVAEAADISGAVAGGIWNYATKKGNEATGEEPGYMQEVYDLAKMRLRRKSYEVYGKMKDRIRSRRMSRPRTLRFGV